MIMVVMLMDASIITSDGCSTRIRFQLIDGCPTECARDSNGDICGGHGSCGYDAGESTAKCFCNAGI